MVPSAPEAEPEVIEIDVSPQIPARKARVSAPVRVENEPEVVFIPQHVDRVEKRILAGVPVDSAKEDQSPKEYQRRVDAVMIVSALAMKKGWGSDEDFEFIMRGQPKEFAKRAGALLGRLKAGGSLSPNETKWLNSSKGYYFAKTLQDHYNERISGLTSTGFDLEEISVSEDRGSNYCMICEVNHQCANINCKKLCEDKEKYGPRNFDWLKVQRRTWQSVEAVFIGLVVLLYVPVHLGEKILNLGLPRKYSYTPGISYQYEVEKQENSLALELWKRLCVVGLKSELPIFIEFFMSEGDCNEWKANLFGFCRVILNLQPYYAGMLVLVIPPMKPGPADDLDSYNEGKKHRSKLARYAQIIGLTVGVPVWVPHIQTFRTETRAWIYRSPKWNNECLFNAENRICREYTSRLGAEISDVLKRVKKGPTPNLFAV